MKASLSSEGSMIPDPSLSKMSKACLISFTSSLERSHLTWSSRLNGLDYCLFSFWPAGLAATGVGFFIDQDILQFYDQIKVNRDLMIFIQQKHQKHQIFICLVQMGKKRRTNTKDRKKSNNLILEAPSQQQILSAITPSEQVYGLRQSLFKDVLLKFQKFDELVQEVDISTCINHKGQLNTKRLLEFLSQKCGFPINTIQIKFLLQDTNIWMSCPKNNINIDEQDYLKYTQIQIKITQCIQLIDTILRDSADQVEHSSQQADDSKKCRRLKERKIKNVIQKVLRWRQLYAGGSNGEQQRIPLQEGARLVKISKKTLDDYLAQIKKGRKYNFNFNEHKNDKIGVLRDFIRKCQRRLQK